MRHFKLLAITLLLGILLIGCNKGKDNELTEHSTENPDAQEVLNLNPDADIFQYNDLIYETDIDWVGEKDLTKDEEVGEIKVKNDKDTYFTNGTASKLSVGTKVYNTKEESEMFLIVELKGETKIYYVLVEG